MMVGNRLSVFLAILAISSRTGFAATTCSDIEDCRKCVNERSGCAWHVGPSFTGCIEADQCNSSDYEDGECFSGKRGCGNSCSVKSGPDSTCGDCLSYDVFGGNAKKGDCAWFVRSGEEPRCIFHKQCDDRGFEGGTCTRGKKDGNNSKKCGTSEPKTCSDTSDCNACLDSNCAWAVHKWAQDGKSKRCFDAEKCDDGSLEDWSCYKGSDMTKSKKVCKRIDNNPRDEMCSNLSGFCSDCLKSGCSWNRDNNKCVDSCDDAPPGANCESPPNSDTSPTTNNGRSLLRFDSQESMLCFNWKYEHKNEKLCHKAGKKGGCERCVSTEQIIPPGVYYVRAPTCMYHPLTGDCAPSCDPDGLDLLCQTDTCFIPDQAAPTESPTYLRLPREAVSWPELLDENVEVAKDFLNDTYGPGTLELEVLKPGDPVTKDKRRNRVRLFVDGETESIIIKVPRTG